MGFDYNSANVAKTSSTPSFQVGAKRTDFQSEKELSIFDNYDKNRNGVIDDGELVCEDNAPAANGEYNKTDTSAELSKQTIEYEQDGTTPSQVITKGDDNSVTTVKYENGKPKSMTVQKGINTSSYIYNDDNEPVLVKTVENAGIPAKEKVTEYEYNEDGSITENITTAEGTKCRVSSFTMDDNQGVLSQHSEAELTNGTKTQADTSISLEGFSQLEDLATSIEENEEVDEDNNDINAKLTGQNTKTTTYTNEDDVKTYTNHQQLDVDFDGNINGTVSHTYNVTSDENDSKTKGVKLDLSRSEGDEYNATVTTTNSSTNNSGTTSNVQNTIGVTYKKAEKSASETDDIDELNDMYEDEDSDLLDDAVSAETPDDEISINASRTKTKSTQHPNDTTIDTTDTQSVNVDRKGNVSGKIVHSKTLSMDDSTTTQSDLVADATRTEDGAYSGSVTSNKTLTAADGSSSAAVKAANAGIDEAGSINATVSSSNAKTEANGAGKSSKMSITFDYTKAPEQDDEVDEYGYDEEYETEDSAPKDNVGLTLGNNRSKTEVDEDGTSHTVTTGQSLKGDIQGNASGSISISRTNKEGEDNTTSNTYNIGAGRQQNGDVNANFENVRTVDNEGESTTITNTVNANFTEANDGIESSGDINAKTHKISTLTGDNGNENVVEDEKTLRVDKDGNTRFSTSHVNNVDLATGSINSAVTTDGEYNEGNIDANLTFSNETQSVDGRSHSSTRTFGLKMRNNTDDIMSEEDGDSQRSVTVSAGNHQERTVLKGDDGTKTVVNDQSINFTDNKFKGSIEHTTTVVENGETTEKHTYSASAGNLDGKLNVGLSSRKDVTDANGQRTSITNKLEVNETEVEGSEEGETVKTVSVTTTKQHGESEELKSIGVNEKGQVQQTTGLRQRLNRNTKAFTNVGHVFDSNDSAYQGSINAGVEYSGNAGDLSLDGGLGYGQDNTTNPSANLKYDLDLNDGKADVDAENGDKKAVYATANYSHDNGFTGEAGYIGKNLKWGKNTTADLNGAVYKTTDKTGVKIAQNIHKGAAVDVQDYDTYNAESKAQNVFENEQAELAKVTGEMVPPKVATIPASGTSNPQIKSSSIKIPAEDVSEMKDGQTQGSEEIPLQNQIQGQATAEEKKSPILKGYTFRSNADVHKNDEGQIVAGGSAGAGYTRINTDTHSRFDGNVNLGISTEGFQADAGISLRKQTAHGGFQTVVGAQYANNDDQGKSISLVNGNAYSFNGAKTSGTVGTFAKYEKSDAGTNFNVSLMGQTTIHKSGTSLVGNLKYNDSNMNDTADRNLSATLGVQQDITSKVSVYANHTVTKSFSGGGITNDTTVGAQYEIVKGIALDVNSKNAEDFNIGIVKKF